MSTRATFVLVPGAGGNASYWDELLPELESRGHEVIPVDIAEDDPTLGLPEYAEITERRSRAATTSSSSRSRWVASPRRWWPRVSRCG